MSEDFWCGYNLKGYYHNESASKIYMDSCYKIKDFNEEEYMTNYHTCRETWDADTNVLDKVTCSGLGQKNITFKPNAWFTEHHIANQVANIPKPIIGVSGDVFLEAGYKDDMYITVGRCSTL